MRNGVFLLFLPALAALAACNRNTSPGSDREAQLEHAPTPAPVVSAGEALSGIAPGVVQPEIMNDADIARLGGLDGRCVVRLTAVAFPSFIYGRDAREGAIKINQKLVRLPGTGGGTFEADGLRVVVRPVDQEFGDDRRREAEMIMLLPGARDELGFRGYEQCYEG